MHRTKQLHMIYHIHSLCIYIYTTWFILKNNGKIWLMTYIYIYTYIYIRICITCIHMWWLLLLKIVDKKDNDVATDGIRKQRYMVRYCMTIGMQNCGGLTLGQATRYLPSIKHGLLENGSFIGDFLLRPPFVVDFNCHVWLPGGTCIFQKKPV